MASHHNQRIDDDRTGLYQRSPESNREIARWLREEVSGTLPTDRQRELAEEAAKRFDERAAGRRD